MKSLLPFLCLILTCINSFSQTNIGYKWQKCYGGSNYEYGNDIQQTTDGGFIIAGKTDSNDGDVTGNHGYSDYWVVKTDQSGIIEWKKTYGGLSDDVANSIQQTTDGGFIVSGYSYSNDGDVTGNHGGRDFWVVKTDQSGTIQWQKTYGGSGYDEANSIQQTSDGGYIIAGNSTSDDGDITGHHGNSFDFDYWVVKTDQLGAIEWQKSYGGSHSEVARSIHQTSEGGYIIAGYSRSIDGEVTDNHGLDDYWIVKTDQSGIIQWQKSYGGSCNEYANCIQQTTDGGFIIAGYGVVQSTGNHQDSIPDYLVIKTDQTGVIEWQKTYGGSGYDDANSIEQTADGGYIVSGYSSSNDGDVTGNHGGGDFWVFKIDESGTIQWQKTYGGSGYDVSNSIQQTIDGSYILSGYSYSNDGNVSGNHGLLDYWILKTCLADPLSISISGSTNCLPTTLTASNGFLSYVWNTGETSRSINPISGGIYNVEATNLSGCKSESQVIISDPQPPFNGEQICMVTMDEQTGKNAIVIEKTLNAGIDSILTYRIDNLTSQYKKVGSISVDNPGIYFDNGAIPSQQNYQYCISIKDSCGQESNLSPVHRTILLQANVGVNNEVNLFWNPYEGFDYPNFEIYRSNDGNPFFLIANVSNNTYTFTDLIPPSGTKRYQVRVSKEIPCDPSKSAFTSASSNIVNPNAIGIIENTASHFSIQPNPATDNLTLKCNADLLGTDYSIADLTGKILISGKIILGELNINVSELTAGMYTFRIGGSGKAAVKIVKK